MYCALISISDYWIIKTQLIKKKWKIICRIIALKVHIKIVPKAIFIQRNNQVLILNDLMLYTWCMNEDWKKNWFSFSVDIMQSLLPNSLHNSVMEIFPGEDLRRRNLSFELFRWGLFRLPEIRWDWITIHCRIHGLLSTLGFTRLVAI